MKLLILYNRLICVVVDSSSTIVFCPMRTSNVVFQETPDIDQTTILSHMQTLVKLNTDEKQM